MWNGVISEIFTNLIVKNKIGGGELLFKIKRNPRHLNERDFEILKIRKHNFWELLLYLFRLR